MNLEDLIISYYDLGVDIDKIVDRVYEKLTDSYNNRHCKAYAYISFGKVTKKECRTIVMTTILQHIRIKDETSKGYY